MPTDSTAVACNLDARGNRRRARVGALLAVVTIVVAVLVMRDGVAPWWRLAVFPPAYGAALGFLQAKAST